MIQMVDSSSSAYSKMLDSGLSPDEILAKRIERNEISAQYVLGDANLLSPAALQFLLQFIEGKEIPFGQELADHLKPNVKIKDYKLGRFTLRSDIVDTFKQMGLWFDHAHYDCKYATVIESESETIAIMGAIALPDTWLIVQNQGKSTKASAFHTGEAMLNHHILEAHKAGIPYIGVRSIENHPKAREYFLHLRSNGIYSRLISFEKATKLSQLEESSLRAKRWDHNVSMPVKISDGLWPRQGRMMYNAVAESCSLIRGRDGNFYGEPAQLVERLTKSRTFL